MLCKAWVDHGETCRVQGVIEGMAEMVIELLEDMGPLPQELRDRIMNEKETDTLKVWVKKAKKTESVEAFMATIE